MLKLKRMAEFETAKYHGFTLKNGFWYGIDTETGNFIATSGWEDTYNVAIYFKKGNSWDMEWVDINSDFCLENIPEINFENKMSFKQWVEEYLGVTWEYFDNNYDGDQESEEYEQYLYDGLPKFVIRYLQFHED